MVFLDAKIKPLSKQHIIWFTLHNYQSLFGHKLFPHHVIFKNIFLFLLQKIPPLMNFQNNINWHSHISMFLVVFAMLKLLSKFDKNGMIHSIKPTIHHERRNTLCLDMWPKLIDHDYYQSLVGSLIFLMHIKL